MTSPSPAPAVLVVPQAVAGVAQELAGLATALSEDADNCRVAAGALSAALDGEDGWAAGAAGRAWADLGEVLAQQAAALAQTLSAAVQAYLDEDDRLAGRVAGGDERPR